MVENEHGKSSHLSFFLHFFEALNDAVSVLISVRASFYTLSKTLIACMAMQFGLFKVENCVKRCL